MEWKAYWNNEELNIKDNLHEQVLRTKKGKVINNELWEMTISTIIENVLTPNNDVVIDLCCGNGVISKELSKHYKKVYAVDFSKNFINTLNNFKISNIHTFCSDILEFEIKNKLDSAILYFALQYFNYNQTLQILEKVFKSLNDGGIFYIGDVPSLDNIFNFFYNDEGKKAYFDNIKKKTPLIGQWFKPEILLEMGKYIGFKDVKIIKQKSFMLNAHYRFDIKFVK